MAELLDPDPPYKGKSLFLPQSPPDAPAMPWQLRKRLEIPASEPEPDPEQKPAQENPDPATDIGPAAKAES